MCRRTTLVQSATLGYRWSKAGPLVMLVTSKGTRRWILPKGGIKPGCKPHESAAEEAYEEAGIIGRISRTCIGFYVYRKSDRRLSAQCKVRVYPMKVTSQLPDWPERRERRREWVTFDVAAARVKEKDLKKIIRSFYQSLPGWSENAKEFRRSPAKP